MLVRGPQQIKLRVSKDAGIGDLGLATQIFASASCRFVRHNPCFPPVPHPTLETGVETSMAAARAWLADGVDD